MGRERNLSLRTSFHIARRQYKLRYIFEIDARCHARTFDRSLLECVNTSLCANAFLIPRRSVSVRIPPPTAHVRYR